MACKPQELAFPHIPLLPIIMFSATLASFIALSLLAGVHADQALSLKLTGMSNNAPSTRI